MTDNDRILCQVLEQQLSLRLREGCGDVLLHLLPAPLRDAELDKLLLGIAEHRQRLADENDGKIVPIAVKIAPDLSDDGVKHVRPAFYET